MNEEIKFALEYLKNKTSDDVLSQKHIKNIEEYIESLIYCINHNNLQSKIDKAIEYINENKYVSADENCEILAGYRIDELLDILKEDK